MPVAIGKPVKLTTWRESNAYKEINIPPPQGAREGQAYRLVLTSHDQGYPHVVNFAAASTGERPFPVMSMPIIFGSRHKAFNTTKQEQVERVYRIPGIGRDQVFLTVKEQTSFDLDKVRKKFLTLPVAASHVRKFGIAV
ncbi:hypothetical protein PHLCEN_2v10144 [Hermanssonia centrifuga]|uniref:Uncharacterized protein n=1 Tax=Hermanssonia centrifuga TaxID=98765 RepID=A0A2R6NPM7_9APHY|nr:hypothetical protein PHLCEN_2v10144 [Hermanssonia centrifuga]